MRDITPETPRKDITIGGFIFSAPTPFAEGDVLNANEANALNQTYLENVGNNFRSRVDTFRRTLIAGEGASADNLKAVTKEQLKDLDAQIEAGTVVVTPEQKAALQSELDALVAEYRINVRRASSVEPIDPVEREARAMAKARIQDYIRSKGYKLNTIKKDWMEEQIDKLLADDNPKGAEIRKAAKKRVEIAQKTAVEEFDDLDFGNAVKAPEAAE